MTDIKGMRPYAAKGDEKRQAKDAAAQRPNDMRVIRQMQRNKLDGRNRNSGENYRAIPTSSSDVLAGDAEGDIVYDNSKMWRAMDIDGALKWKPIGYAAKKVIFVSEPADFGAITNNRVTPDSDFLYMIDGTVDMGSVSIEVSDGGLSLAGLNGGRDVMVLTSSADNYTMFVSPSGGYSGDIVIESMSLTTNGTSSQVFDLDNDGNSNAIDITGVNFTDCTSLGHLTDYRQLLLNNVGFIFIDDGLTFNGDWSGLAVVTSIVIGFPAATLFKEGTSLAFDGSVRSDINFNSVNSASILFDFQESNITSKGGFSLNNVRTTATDAVPNFQSSSVYARFRNCIGIKNTYVGGQWYISSASVTTINTISVPEKIAGTTTYNDMQWFSQTTNNAFVYDGDQTIDVEIKGNLSFTGTNGDVINIYVRLWDDSASSYVDLSETAGSTLNASGRAEGVSFNAIGTMDNSDRIELWVENDSGARDVTALVNGYVILSERSS